MHGYRKIEPLPRKANGNEPGPAPEIVFVAMDQLVVNDDYQRDLNAKSIRRIREMAENWDWAGFKAPSLARTENPDVYEIVDGQHTAIAAATNGNIHFLPCLVMDAETLAQKAQGFLTINVNRVALTKAAIYTAQVAAQDPDAIAVEVAISCSGVNLLAFPPANSKFQVGDTMAIGTMLDIAHRRGSERLATLLQVGIDAKAAPVSACLLKALDIALPLNPPDDIVNRTVVVLRGQGCARLEVIAKSRTAYGRRVFETFADSLADMAKLPSHRMGVPPAKAKGRPRLAKAA